MVHRKILKPKILQIKALSRLLQRDETSVTQSTDGIIVNVALIRDLEKGNVIF
jgi:hypothetical protein